MVELMGRIGNSSDSAKKSDGSALEGVKERIEWMGKCESGSKHYILWSPTGFEQYVVDNLGRKW
jgi:hypothetical protein